MVTRAQAHARTILVRQLGVALEQDDPLVAALLEPLSRRCRVPGRDDPFDRDSFSAGHSLHELLGKTPERSREKIPSNFELRQR
jgi:hypothetical protein